MLLTSILSNHVEGTASEFLLEEEIHWAPIIFKLEEIDTHILQDVGVNVERISLEVMRQYTKSYCEAKKDIENYEDQMSKSNEFARAITILEHNKLELCKEPINLEQRLSKVRFGRWGYPHRLLTGDMLEHFLLTHSLFHMVSYVFPKKKNTKRFCYSTRNFGLSVHRNYNDLGQYGLEISRDSWIEKEENNKDIYSIRSYKECIKLDDIDPFDGMMCNVEDTVPINAERVRFGSQRWCMIIEESERGSIAAAKPLMTFMFNWLNFTSWLNMWLKGKTKGYILYFMIHLFDTEDLKGKYELKIDDFIDLLYHLELIDEETKEEFMLLGD